MNTLEISAVIVTRGDVRLTDIAKTFWARAGTGHPELLPESYVREMAITADKRTKVPGVEFLDIIVWDNSKRLDMGPFGQFVAATTQARGDIVYFQDDDVLTDPAAICAQWEPGAIVCNMPATHRANYASMPDKLMGFGSCFEKKLIRETFERYWKVFPVDHVTLREPGRIFTALNQSRIKLVDVPKEDLPWATADNRLYRQPDHVTMAEEARLRVRRVLQQEGFRP